MRASLRAGFYFEWPTERARWMLDFLAEQLGECGSVVFLLRVGNTGTNLALLLFEVEQAQRSDRTFHEFRREQFSSLIKHSARTLRS